MGRRRNHPAERARRNVLAKERGFPNYWAQRKGARYPATGRDLGRLPEPAREARTDALRVIDLADRKDLTIEEATQRLGVRRSVVDWFAGDALGRTRRGITRPTETDELLRLRPMLLDDDVAFVETLDRRKAREAEHIFDVQWRYIHGTATRAELDRLPKSFGGRRVVKDPAELTEIGRRRQLLDIPDAYREVLG
jgi:hypothetical protein